MWQATSWYGPTTVTPKVRMTPTRATSICSTFPPARDADHPPSKRANPTCDQRQSDRVGRLPQREESNGYNGDIYAYDTVSKQEFPIVTAPDLQTDPAIYGNVVVWQDYRNAKDSNDYNADIYGYDLSTKKEFPVTTAASRQARPTIAGNLVAWADYRNEPDQANGVNSDIYGYDLASRQEFPVFLGPGTQDAPTIGGTTVAYETNPDPKGKAHGASTA